MSKVAWFIAGIIVLVIINFVPLARGDKLLCVNGQLSSNRRMLVAGVPFGYSSWRNTEDADCSDSHQFFKYDGSRSNVIPQVPADNTNLYLLLLDLVIDGAVLIGLHLLLGQRKKKS
ncbi:MAG TPA: hypothetical protein VLG13_03090 [Patescibacteria group bacterium]|nr:hypothetical protein [Patescibacteria group bacterium]